MGLFDADDWGFLARALGFFPYQACAGYGSQASFRHLERAMGAPAAGAPSYTHWLHGTRNGHPAIITHYSTGSGRNRSHWTAVVVRIDPPLFLGVAIGAEMFLSDLFGGVDVRLGIPAFDAELRLGALDPDRLRALLWPSDARGTALLQALVRYTKAGMHVSDSTAVFTLSGLVEDPSRIALVLDEAAWTADELAARRAALPPTAAEIAHRAEWQAYADASHLQFDPSRMKISGDLRGTHVEIALETNSGRVQTAVTVHWPHSIGVSMRVLKSGAFGFLTGLFGQDIRTGDALFDDAFVVQGHPEPHVRHVLSNPELRSTLRSVAAHANELAMNHAGIFWMCPGPALRSADLEAHVTMALRTTRSIFGTVQAQQPFR